MTLKLQAPATVPAVTLAEAKLHLRIDTSAEDALLTSLVVAATQDAEHLMGRAVMPQKWQLTLDTFFDPSVFSEPAPLTIDIVRGPSYVTGSTALQLARPTVTAVDTVKYIDPTGVLQTLASTEYQLAAASDYTARLLPAYGKSWPAIRPQPEAVQVVFSCGYADAASVPELVKAWIKLRVGALYENKQMWTMGKAIEPNEFLDRLLDRYRVWSC